ncbi:MAG TPA: hypothetical protein VGJ04_04295 [Pirellulales bacterium]|jgi:hypothetical protein
MQTSNRRPNWLWSMIAACVLFNGGCGGDAYEKQFDESLQHLKTTGQPLGRQPAAPQPEPTSQPGTDGNQQPPQP